MRSSVVRALIRLVGLIGLLSFPLSTLAVAEMDLSQQQWTPGQVINLDGDWSFYWQQLLTPESLATASDATLFHVPGLWNQRHDQRPAYPPFGFASLALRVRVPDDHQPYYLKIPDMLSAYKLWVNGELMAQNGVPGTSAETEKPLFLPALIKVEARQGELNLLVQISNFHNKEGGIWHSLQLTDSAGRLSLYEVPMLIDVSVFAVLFTIGFYHLSVFWMRRKERASLYFGLFCMAVGFRGLLVGQRVFYILGIGSWEVLYRVEHLMFYLGLPLFAQFYRYLFPQDVGRRFPDLCMAVALLFSASAILLPAYIYTQLTTPYQVVTLAACAYMTWTFRLVWRRRRPGAGLFGFSFLITFATVLNDVLYAHLLVRTPPLIHIGLLIFVVTQAVLLNRRYVSSLQMVEDMSAELQHRNLELERLNQFKDEFLATTSHELRTPLHGIAGLTDLLLQDDEGRLSADQTQQLQLIAASAKRLGGLVNDILDYSAIKHGNLQLVRRRVDLRAVGNLVLSSIRPLVAGKHIQLSLEVDENARFVEADENRLQQILFNLVGNSMKFTEQGSIGIAARLRGNRVAVTVSDSGVGIAAEKMRGLFRPFEPINLELGAAWGSSGLGLTICRQLVEGHGGVLGIDSEVGVGTRVTFDLAPAGAPQLEVPHAEPATENRMVLARLQEAEAAAETPAWETQPKAVEGTRVFVVDDEEVNRQLLRQQLEHAGYQVECFVSGRALLQRLPEQMPDLVVLDLMMPQMNGFQVCERLREQFNSYELPVMMLTARHQVGDIVHALALGANDYLFKPHHQREMLARVESLAGQRRFWLASLENEQLRAEIERRRTAERGLQASNQRLIRLLDCSLELVLLTDDQGRVIYVNEACQKVWQKPRSAFAGLRIDSLLPQQPALDLQRLSEQQDPRQIRLASSDEAIWQLRTVRIEHDYEHFFALILNQQSALPAALQANNNRAADAPELLQQLTSELNESRKRIDALQEVLHSVAGDLTDEAETLAPAAASPAQQSAVRNNLVELMRFCLSLWERSTGKTKVELAEESRCWRVYVDGSTVKTRTLDKYLSNRSLPENPRWRLVLRTANFVRSRCDLDAADQQRLDELMQALETAYS